MERVVVGMVGTSFLPRGTLALGRLDSSFGVHWQQQQPHQRQELRIGGVPAAGLTAVIPPRPPQ